MPKKLPTDPTPFEYAKLLEGRIALEFPSSVIKEEKVSESYDKNTARYVVVWYNEAEDGKAVDLTPSVKRLAPEVLDAGADELFSVELSEATRSRFTSQIMVTYTRKEQRVAAAADEPKVMDSGLLLQMGEAAYRIISTSMGTSWEVVDVNGTTVESDLQSVPAALAKALKHLLVDLSYAEEVSGGKSSDKAQADLDRAFLGELASWFVNSPVINKEAKKHLVALVELVTKRDFAAELTEAE